MTELDSLRGRTWSPPPSGALDAVVTAGRSRRRVFASGTSMLAAAGLVLAFQLVPGDDDRQTLVPAQRVDVAPRVSPSPTVSARAATTGQRAPRTTPAAGTRAVAAPAAPATAAGAETRRRTVEAPRPQPRPAEPGPRVAGTAARTGVYAPLAKIRATGPDPTPCEYQGTNATVCAVEGSDADVGPAANGQRSVGFHQCSREGEPRTLRFAGEEEVVLTIRDANNELVWRWRPLRPYRAVPHSEVVRGGECLFWTTSWRQVDDAGAPVPPGTYTLSVTFLEQAVGGTERRRFTVVP